jgi:hypothetical protein
MISLRPPSDTGASFGRQYNFQQVCGALPAARGLRIFIPFYYNFPEDAFFSKSPMRPDIIRAAGITRADFVEDAALYFDGPNTSDYVSILNSCDLAGASQATIIGRGYHYASTNSCGVAACALTGDIRFGFFVNSANQMITWAQGITGYGAVACGPAGYNIWATVFNGSLTGNAARLKLYKNGVQQTLAYTGTVPATLSPGLTRLDIGRYIANGTSGFAFTWMVWLAVWNRALTPTEVEIMTTTEGFRPFMRNHRPQRLGFHTAAANMFRSRAASRARFAGHHRMIGAGQ